MYTEGKVAAGWSTISPVGGDLCLLTNHQLPPGFARGHACVHGRTGILEVLDRGGTRLHIGNSGRHFVPLAPPQKYDWTIARFHVDTGELPFPAGWFPAPQRALGFTRPAVGTTCWLRGWAMHSGPLEETVGFGAVVESAALREEPHDPPSPDGAPPAMRIELAEHEFLVSVRSGSFGPGASGGVAMIRDSTSPDGWRIVGIVNRLTLDPSRNEILMVCTLLPEELKAHVPESAWRP